MGLVIPGRSVPYSFKMVYLDRKRLGRAAAKTSTLLRTRDRTERSFAIGESLQIQSHRLGLGEP